MAYSIAAMVRQLRRMLIVGQILGKHKDAMPAFNDSLGTEGDEEYNESQLIQAAKNWACVEESKVVMEAEIDEAIEEFESTTEQSRPDVNIDDSESDATEDSSDEICVPVSSGTEHVVALRRHLKSINASNELNNLLTRLEKKMRMERAARSTSQPNLLNLWSKK